MSTTAQFWHCLPFSKFRWSTSADCAVASDTSTHTCHPTNILPQHVLSFYVPTCHVMVSMALTNQRRSRQGRNTSDGAERALDLSTTRLSRPWTNERPNVQRPKLTHVLINTFRQFRCENSPELEVFLLFQWTVPNVVCCGNFGLDIPLNPFACALSMWKKCTFDKFLVTGRNFFVMQNCK